MAEEREPLQPTDKLKLTLLIGGAAVAFGTILFSGASADSEVRIAARVRCLVVPALPSRVEFQIFFLFFFSFLFFFRLFRRGKFVSARKRAAHGARRTAEQATSDAEQAMADRYPTLARERLFATYGYMASGIALTAVTAVAAARNPAVVRFAAQRPMVFMLGGAGVSIAGMLGAQSISPDNALLKHASFAVFTGAQVRQKRPFEGPLYV